MKKEIFLTFFHLIFFQTFAQINSDSVTFYLFELMNEERVRCGIPKRYRSIYCKKAAELHTAYIKKYTISEGHDESRILVGNKVLEKSMDRYNYFNRDSFKVCITDYCYYRKYFNYQAEIATWQKFIGIAVPDLKRKDINKFFARSAFENFMNSEPHKQRILQEFEGRILRGYFGFDYKINPDGTLEFFCVGFFDFSSQATEVHKDVYKSDYYKIY